MEVILKAAAHRYGGPLFSKNIVGNACTLVYNSVQYVF